MEFKATVIDGKKKSRSILDNLKTCTERLKAQHNITPGLSVIRVGDDPASETYVASKANQARKLGFNFNEYHFKSDVEISTLLDCISTLNNDSRVHGAIIQLPLPKGYNKTSLLQAIDPNKDVDGLHHSNQGKLWQNNASGFVPCTPRGCKILLESVHEDLAGVNALVIGESILVGRPMAALLLNAGATVTLAHIQTDNLPDLCKNADIIVVAIGDPQFIKAEWIKPGATVLDVGINRLDDGLIVGDVEFEKALKVAGAITPVPGGVGPMTVACLMLNTYIAAERCCGSNYFQE